MPPLIRLFGLTPCRQLRPSSRREHVKASKSTVAEKYNLSHVQHFSATIDISLLRLIFLSSARISALGRDSPPTAESPPSGMLAKYEKTPKSDRLCALLKNVTLPLKK